MIIQWTYGDFNNGSEQFECRVKNNSISGLYAKAKSCRINAGPVLLQAGDKIKIVSKSIGGAAPFITSSNSVRLRITKAG